MCMRQKALMEKNKTKRNPCPIMKSLAILPRKKIVHVS